MFAGHCMSRVWGRGFTAFWACAIAMAEAALIAPWTVALFSRHLGKKEILALEFCQCTGSEACQYLFDLGFHLKISTGGKKTISRAPNAVDNSWIYMPWCVTHFLTDLEVYKQSSDEWLRIVRQEMSNKRYKKWDLCLSAKKEEHLYRNKSDGVRG